MHSIYERHFYVLLFKRRREEEEEEGKETHEMVNLDN